MPTAIETACAHIEKAFRPHRLRHEDTLLQWARLRELVKAGRYTKSQATRELKIEPNAVIRSLRWIERDNRVLNKQFGTDLHRLHHHEIETKKELMA